MSRDGKYRDGRGGGANTGELLIMQLSKLRTVDGYTACRLKQFKCSKLSNIEGILQKYCEGTNWNWRIAYLFFTHQNLLFSNVEQQWTLHLSSLDKSSELHIFMFVSRLYTEEMA